MINRKDITSAAKRMLRQHRGLTDPQIIHPSRDWFIGLIISSIIFILIAWWSVSAHIKHSNTNIDGSVEAASTDTVYREAQVNAALELFEKRTEKYNSLIGSGVREPAIEEPPVVEEGSVATTTESVLQEVVPPSVESGESTPESRF